VEKGTMIFYSNSQLQASFILNLSREKLSSVSSESTMDNSKYLAQFKVNNFQGEKSLKNYILTPYQSLHLTVRMYDRNNRG